MPSRFPIAAVPVVNDPFCEDGFCLSDPCVITVNQLGDYVGQTYQIVGATSVQWQADGSDIAGAVGQTYTSTTSDIGKVITARAANGLVYDRCVGPSGYVGQDTEPASRYEVYLRVGGYYCKDPGGIPPGVPCGGAASVPRTGTCAQSSVIYYVGTVDRYWPVNAVTNGEEIQLRVSTVMYDPSGCLEACGCMPGQSICSEPGPQYPLGLVDVCDATRYFTEVQYLDIRDTPAVWKRLGFVQVISSYLGHGADAFLDAFILVKQF